MAKQLKRTRNAIALVNQGMTRYKAARACGIALSTIYAAYPIGSTNYSTIGESICHIADQLRAGLKSDYDEKQGNP